jgi:hypothetical protein
MIGRVPTQYDYDVLVSSFTFWSSVVTTLVFSLTNMKRRPCVSQLSTQIIHTVNPERCPFFVPNQNHLSVKSLAH